ncbi:substrate-binding periplasmic protein [Azospirillum halopraeferens]|uniref:substrate-binding periplasmic protein n=1 Tax=Azospirillum halopraeferens TaxID=34010 RepID=UPI0004086A70|nr:transporter substrate-binding domain-containing protein [Azospirillum halopraeferens]
MFSSKERNPLASAFGAAARLVAAGVLLAGAFGVQPAAAQVTQAVTASFAPLTDESSPDRKGLIHDVVAEMLKLQGISAPIQFMAWSEAVKIADGKPGTIIFPMTRTPQREDKYLWLAKVFDMNRSFVTRPGSPAVNTVEAAKALKAVGTTEASASLTFLKAKEFTNIVEIKSSRELMQALKDGKVDAVYQPNPFAKADWKAVGGDGALTVGEVQEVAAAYLAANKQSSLNPDDWQGALQVLEQDGTFEKLVQAYGMN